MSSATIGFSVVAFTQKPKTNVTDAGRAFARTVIIRIGTARWTLPFDLFDGSQLRLQASALGPPQGDNERALRLQLGVDHL